MPRTASQGGLPGLAATDGSAGAQRLPDPSFERQDALSISALMAEVRHALAAAFPPARTLWVRGEIHSVTDHRSGHCYIDLVDPDTAGGRDAPTLKVNCWRSVWGPIKRELVARGIELQPGMVVALRGRVELYAPRAQVNFVALELDVDALLGRLAAQRAALLRTLEAEGLLRRQAGLAVPDVPLRVGLVASPGSEGYRDFVGQLLGSGYAFHVRHVPVRVQGASAARAIAAAVRALADGGSDLVVVVRGGGSRADLAVFDTEPVARAVAGAAVPVWTGIGHTGDQSVADAVANRAFVTPTECGQELARQVGQWWRARTEAAAALSRHARRVAEEAAGHGTAARARLVACTRSQLQRRGDRLVSRGRRLAATAPRAVQAAEVGLAVRGSRLAPLAKGSLDRHRERVEGWRRLIEAYDVGRQLRRGYTLTYDAGGRILRSAGALAPGDTVVTRFADGTVRSTVEADRSTEEAGRETAAATGADGAEGGG